MNTITELSIRQFEAGDIDPERFDHEAHVRMAWLYIDEYPLGDAIRRFDAALRRFVKQVGAEDKYHATITWFFLLLINERHRPDESWEAFRQRNPDLITNSRDTLSRYYTQDCLFSDQARRHFLLPNKLAA